MRLLLKEVNTLRVHLILAFVALLWGINAPVMKIGLFYVEPMPYNAARMIVALVVGWPILKRLARWLPLQKKDWKPLIISSLGFFFFQIFFTYGVKNTTAGNSALILGCLPISVAVINHLHKFERIGTRMIVSILVSMAGVVIMVAGTDSEISLSDRHVFGAVMLLIAQFGYGYYTVFSRSLTKVYSAYQVTAYILVISTGIFVLVSVPAFAAVDWESVPKAGWGSILYSGLFPLFLGNVLWIWGVKVLGSAKTSLYNNLPPVFSIITAYLLLREPFGLLQFMGAAVIFVGLYLAKGSKTPMPERNQISETT